MKNGTIKHLKQPPRNERRDACKTAENHENYLAKKNTDVLNQFKNIGIQRNLDFTKSKAGWLLFLLLTLEAVNAIPTVPDLTEPGKNGGLRILDTNNSHDSLIPEKPSIPAPLPSLSTSLNTQNSGDDTHINIERYIIPEKQLFISCKDNCDMALNSLGEIKEINSISFDPENLLPFFPIHIEDLVEIKKKNDFPTFKQLMEKGIEHIKTELQKTGRFREIIIIKANKIEITKDGRMNNQEFLTKVSTQLSKLLKVEEKEIITQINVILKKQKEKNKGENAIDISLSDEFYNHIKDTIILPKLNSLLTTKNLEQQFQNLQKIKFNEEKRNEILQRFRDIEKIGLESEVRRGYNDRLEKIEKNNCPAIVFEENPDGNQRVGGDFSLRSSHISFFLNNIIHNTAEGIRTFGHEPLHAYDGQLCLLNSIQNKNYTTEEFIVPCGNNKKQIKGFATKLTLAIQKDKEKFINFADQPKGRFENENKLKEALLASNYPIILDTQLLNQRISPISKNIGLERLKNLPFEIITYLTDRIDPKSLLEFVHNCAYLRGFTIHDNGKDETKLYINLLQGNSKEVKSIIEKDAGLLDKQYDKIPLIEIARIIKNYDEALSNEVKLYNSKTKRGKKRFKNMVNMVEEYYKEHEKKKSHETIPSPFVNNNKQEL